jgi:hypothetical protein
MSPKKDPLHVWLRLCRAVTPLTDGLPDNPTSQELDIHCRPRTLEEMIATRPGNVVPWRDKTCSACSPQAAASRPGLSKLARNLGTPCGSAAPLCGMAAPFRRSAPVSSSSAPPGRLSLPGGAEEVGCLSPAPERRSLSAQQAAKPQIIVNRGQRSLDKPASRPPLHPRPELGYYRWAHFSLDRDGSGDIVWLSYKSAGERAYAWQADNTAQRSQLGDGARH